MQFQAFHRQDKWDVHIVSSALLLRGEVFFPVQESDAGHVELCL